jgi:hypothetical protein
VTVSVVHARQPGPRRSPHRTGRITPDHILDRDPRRLTLCGAEPTDRDLANYQARWKNTRPYQTCRDCAALIDGSTR